MQSNFLSWAEAITNTFVGFFISVVVTLLIMPLWGFEPTAKDAVEITVVYSAISIVRGYVVRRLFNFSQRNKLYLRLKDTASKLN